MENKSWENIWNNRKKIELNSSISTKEKLDILLNMDGFDTGTGSIKGEHFIEFTKSLINRFKIKKSDSIFEIGCGAGAFLFPFHELGLKVGGIDYSSILINTAKELFKTETFFVQEAIEIDDFKKYDYVVAFSVFFYFADFDYAAIVLSKMYHKARKAVLILDVPDTLTKEACEKMRRGTMPAELYEKKYAGLSHLYYDRSFFINNANLLGAKDCTIEQQNIDNYINNEFRFNCLIIK